MQHKYLALNRSARFIASFTALEKQAEKRILFGADASHSFQIRVIRGYILIAKI
jgi:hypothetical protein